MYHINTIKQELNTEHNWLDERSIVDRHRCRMDAKLCANSSSCTTTELFIILTSCLMAIKNHVIKDYVTFLRRIVKIYFGLLKINLKCLTN